MRRLIVVVWLVICIASYGEAQELAPKPDWLPDVPLREGVFGLDTPQVIWLDDDTLIFEHEEESRGYELATFQYQAATGELTLLEDMPLRLALADVVVEHYQSAEGEPIYLSPFTGDVFTPVIYHSRLSVHCGHECGGDLIMLGYYPETTDISMGNYAPLAGVYAQCGIRASWGRADVAVIHVGSCYGGPAWGLYLVNRNGSHPATTLPLRIGATGDYEQHLLAIAEDGSRVLYDSFTREQDPETLNESLFYWQSRRPTADQPLPTIEREIEFRANNRSLYPFAAASFIRGDAAHILAVHTDGLLRIHLDSDTREVLNPEMNAQWIRVGYFSPDNRYLMLVTWDGDLHVIETGI